MEDITDPKLDINKKRETLEWYSSTSIFFSHMTVKKTLCCTLLNPRRDKCKAEETAYLGLLDRVGLKDKADSLSSTVIFGWLRNRVVVARALAMKLRYYV